MDITPEDRTRALVLAQGRMLEALWVYVLSAQPDPIEEAAALSSLTIGETEDFFDLVRGRVEESAEHLTIDHMEKMWGRITEELASHDRPIDVELPPHDEGMPTGRPAEEAPSDEPDESPGQ